MFYTHIGETQIKSLMTWIKKVDVFITYVIKELEEMCMEKFYKWKTDQFVLVVDMKNTKLKDLQNKDTQAIVKAVVELFTKYYPSIVHRVFVLNAPMFFDDVWEDMNELVGEDSSDYKQFIISNKNTHPELTSLVAAENLPTVYGGKSKFDLSKGLFNEVGPWSMDTELIWIGQEEFKDEDEGDDFGEEDEGIDDDIKTAIQGIPSFPGGMMKKTTTKSKHKDESGAQFNLEAVGELINQTPNATPMNTYADDED